MRHIEYMPIAAIQGDVRNPKAHADEDIDESIDRFGFTEPIILDERTGRLVAGHGRLGVLRAMHDQERPAPEGVTVADDGSWQVPVVRGWASKDDDEAGAYLIASNRLTEKGGWHDDPLADLLRGLSELPSGLSGTGYSSDEVEDLLARLTPPPSLDDLAARLGRSNPDDFWPTLSFKVPPELRERFLALTGHIKDGGHERFELLVAIAEGTKRRPRPKKDPVPA